MNELKGSQMLKVLIILTLTLLHSVSNASDLESVCRMNSGKRAKAICSDEQFIASAINFETNYWTAIKNAKTLSDLKTLENAKSQFNWKHFLNCSPIELALPRKINEYLECNRNVFSEFKKKFDDTYTDALIADVKDRNSELALAKKNYDKFVTEKTLQVMVCQVQATDKLDDNVSPASDIAIAVTSACKVQAMEFAQMTVDYIDSYFFPFEKYEGNPNTQDVVANIYEQYYGQQATIKFILKRRSEKLATIREYERQRLEEIKRKDDEKKRPLKKTI